MDDMLNAAAKGSLTSVIAALNSGLTVSSATANGVTLLHVAAAFNNVRVARYVLAEGARVDARCNLTVNADVVELHDNLKLDTRALAALGLKRNPTAHVFTKLGFGALSLGSLALVVLPKASPLIYHGAATSSFQALRLILIDLFSSTTFAGVASWLSLASAVCIAEELAGAYQDGRVLTGYNRAIDKYWRGVTFSIVPALTLTLTGLPADFRYKKVAFGLAFGLFSAGLLFNAVSMHYLHRTEQSPAHLLNAREITPFHLAAMLGHFEIAELLIGEGCNITQRTASGLTALEMCRNSPRAQAVEALILTHAKSKK
jgi:hypothetical protein